MKRIAYNILFFLASALSVHAQSYTRAQLEGTGMKDFGGFIIDMGTMLNAESLTVDMYLPPLSAIGALPLTTPYLLNPDAFRIHPGVTYSAGTNTGIRTGMGTSMVNWKGASYKLNNGTRINLYGQYDADGNRVYNPSALPWQRNNFNAAFEVKSANGNFGIKLEVYGGRNNPY